MAGIEKLSASRISRILRPGKYGDGGGLYLYISPTLCRHWVFRYQREREHYMGLGSLRVVGLVDARAKAREARALLAQGIDPMQARAAPSSVDEDSKTFDDCADEYIARHQGAWQNGRNRLQWINSLRAYASPHIGNVSIRRIGTAHVISVLEPIWMEKTETAKRVRGRIERILSWAAIKGYRTGDNPARWQGHLQELLPTPARIRKTVHHPAMSYWRVSAFFRKLDAASGLDAQALALTILTAARSAEILQAQWGEFDLAHGVWVVPAHRMKSGREHRVPLSEPAVEILRSLEGLGKQWVFPGAKAGKPLSNSALLSVMRRMGRAETVHGFRSSFRDWAAEQTNHPREVCEHALAHRVPGAIETAYLRSDLLERRRVLMDEWAAWCLGDWCATKNGPPRAAPIPGPNADVTKPGAGPGIREITLD